MTRLIAADRSARTGPLTLDAGGPWQDHAACTELDPDAFFAEGAYSDFEDARTTCVTLCSVRAECLAMALDSNLSDGMYGGLDPKERRSLRRKALPSRQVEAAAEAKRREAMFNANRLDLYNAGATDEHMARTLGVSMDSIRHWRRHRSLERHREGGASSREDQAAARLAMYEQGYSDRQMAAAEKVDRVAIQQWRIRRGLPANLSKKDAS